MTFQELFLYIVHYILALRRALLLLFYRMKPLRFPFKKQTGVCRIRQDSKGLMKLPIHMGVVIVEDDISYADVANIIVWSVAMGVYYITLYDRAGNLKRNSERIHSEFQKQEQMLQEANSKFDIEIFKSRSWKSKQINGYSKKKANVILLSHEDGRRTLVDTARQLSRAVSSREFTLDELTPNYLEELLLEKQGFPDPDLVLRFGDVDSLLGYLPWQTRLTEILSIPSLHKFSYESFVLALNAFGNTQQRFGK